MSYEPQLRPASLSRDEAAQLATLILQKLSSQHSRAEIRLILRAMNRIYHASHPPGSELEALLPPDDQP